MTEGENVDRVLDEGRLLADGFRDTDTGNANRLVATAGEEVRHVPSWGKWVVYRDGHWQLDHGNVFVTEIAKRVAQRMFQVAVNAPHLDSRQRDELLDWAKRSESAAAISNLVRLAAGIPGVVVDHADLDARPELLNVLNGTVDLRTGVLLAHDPEHLLTGMCPVAYDPSATAPLWDHCLRRWQPDELRRAYLQLCAGAGATGYPVEEFHVHHGGGRNGKGKFFDALLHVLGPYAITPDRSLLVMTRHEPHPTVWAHLYGARLAVGDETTEGARLNEEKVKRLTGGGRLDGRRMREDVWEFEPTHLLVVRTNHLPQLRSADEAMRRRLRVIPWDVTIPDAEDDKQLPDKLKAEAAGILAWVVRGATEWLARDRQLPAPPAVVEQTAGLFRDADPVGWFLGIATVTGDGHQITTRELHEAYLCWRTDPNHDEQPRAVSQAELSRYVGDRGYRKGQWRVPGQANAVRGWRGLALNPAFLELVAWVRVNVPARLQEDADDLPTWRGM
jgi:putative DNA primase/helicase